MISNPVPIRNTIYFLVLMIARNVLGPMDVWSFNTKNHKKQNRDIRMCLVYQGENDAWSSGDFLPSSASLSRVLRGYVCFQWFGRCLPDGSKLNNFVRKVRYFNSDLSALNESTNQQNNVAAHPIKATRTSSSGYLLCTSRNVWEL